MYKRDLAYIQHVGFSDFAKRIGPGVLTELRRANIVSGRVLDLGCGDGTWLRMLVAAGYSVAGIDQSKDLVRYAVKGASDARVRVGSIHDARFPRCDAITALGEVFSYRSKRDPGLRSFRRVLRRAHLALRPGGVLLFDMLVAGRFMRYETWRTGKDWALLARVVEEPNWHRLIRDIVTFRKTAEGYRRGYERHVLYVLTREAIIRELRGVGFRVRTQRHYGLVSLPVRRVAFVARKPLAAAR